MKRVFYSFWYRLFGWKIVGAPPKLNKYVIAVAPHTSNIDFFVGLCVKYIVKDFKPNFLAKNSLFKIPIVGWFLKSVGGIPVDRSKKTKMVDQIVEIFEKRDQFIMTITPEGTRSYVPEWKTGFYYVAHMAKVPIVMAGFDYTHKTVEFTEPFYTTGDVEKDIEFIKDYFRKKVGRYPEKGVK